MRALLGFTLADLALSALVLAAMAVEVFKPRDGIEHAALNFVIVVAGVLYIGWLGAYLVSLRNLPGGKWWLLLVLLAVMFTDAGAFLVGRQIGRTPFSPVLSPKKTWEGYFGGILIAALLSALLGWLFGMLTPSITAQRGLLLGLIVSIVSPVGDLGESMIKRQFGVKDSSNLLPGHGGVMDRVDTWLWAAAIGYYLIGLWWM